MSKNTFEDITEKKLGGAWAYFTGRAKVLHGSCWTMKDFDDKIISKYFDKYYSSTIKDKY
jgi:hypothetical protein